jgi:battenin
VLPFGCLVSRIDLSLIVGNARPGIITISAADHGGWNSYRALIGLINNVLYVIILSAALDLVGPDVPKGVVLLVDVVPSFGTKLIAPYFIHVIPYSTKVLIFVLLSVLGMLLIALTPAYTDGGAISTKLAGVILASLSSGGGELSFVGLTHFYGPFSLASWGSGTGAAGLVGAGAYALATTTFGFSVRTTLLISACLPAVMVLSFFTILPRDPLQYPPSGHSHYQSVLGAVDDSEAVEADREAGYDEHDQLLSPPNFEHEDQKHIQMDRSLRGWKSFTSNLKRTRSLFFPLWVHWLETNRVL